VEISKNLFDRQFAVADGMVVGLNRNKRAVPNLFDIVQVDFSNPMPIPIEKIIEGLASHCEVADVQTDRQPQLLDKRADEFHRVGDQVLDADLLGFDEAKEGLEALRDISQEEFAEPSGGTVCEHATCRLLDHAGNVEDIVLRNEGTNDFHHSPVGFYGYSSYILDARGKVETSHAREMQGKGESFFGLIGQENIPDFLLEPSGKRIRGDGEDLSGQLDVASPVVHAPFNQGRKHSSGRRVEQGFGQPGGME
jgi:hypothetical protein